MSTGFEGFRLSLWWSLLVLVLLGAVSGAVGPLTVTLLLRAPVRMDTLAFSVLGGAVFAFLLALMMVFAYQTYIGPTGLRGHDFWGIYHFVEWRDIESARRFNMLGLPCVRVRRFEGRTVWVPRFLEDQPYFEELVQEYAGPDNPLTRALHDRGTYYADDQDGDEPEA